MGLRAWIVAAALVAGCVTYSGSNLVPGQSTLQDVEAVMGQPTLVRDKPNGEKILWYSRLPFGRENYAARIGPDGKLLSLDQRLTPENIARLRRNESTTDEVLDLLGPPHRSVQYPIKQRETWDYPLRTPPDNRTLIVEFSPDRVARDIYQLDDPDRSFFPFMR